MAKKNQSLTQLIADDVTARKLYDLVKWEEKKIDKLYENWTLEEKLSFILKFNDSTCKNKITEATSRMDQLVDECLVFNNERSVTERNSQRQKDIEMMKELGFIVAYEQEERETHSYDFSDGNGCPLFPPTGFYRDTFFVHPKKAICIGMEHVFDKVAYNLRATMTGYMILDTANLREEDIDNYFLSFLIDFYKVEHYGENKVSISLGSNGIGKALEYLKEDLISDYDDGILLNPKYLPLEVESTWLGDYYTPRRREYCDKLIQNMVPEARQYFDNSEKQYVYNPKKIIHHKSDFIKKSDN